LAVQLEAKSGASEMLEAAAEQLTELGVQIAALDKQIQNLANEIEDVRSARDEASAEHEAVKARYKQAVEADQNEAAFLRLASGTLREGEAVERAKAARQALQSAKKALAASDKTYGEALTGYTSREEKLLHDLHLLKFERDVRQAEKDVVERGAKLARRERGLELLIEFKQRFIDKAEQIAAARSELAKLEAEREQLQAEAKIQLADWPDHLRSLSGLEDTEDATTRALSKGIEYLTMLLDDWSSVRNLA
jgi:chromosome segregation ATPase